MKVRKSTEQDLDQIENLIMLCFGDRRRWGWYENLNDRYYLCIDETNEDKVVGMTGLISNEEYVGGPELDWSGVLPEYRKRGIMTLLITQALRDAMSKGIKRVYCSAWKVSPNPKANLQSILESLGFRCVNLRVSWTWGYNCLESNSPGDKNYCVNCRLDGCQCCELLFVKDL